MPLPTLKTETGQSEGVALVIYAPFGTDAMLSTYPDGESADLMQHPLVQHALQVSRHGVQVFALIDRVAEQSSLLEIPAFRPEAARVTSRWKQDMASPFTLAGLLRHVNQSAPGASIVLALEGHGAGFLPCLDASKLTAQAVTMDGQIEWHVASDGTTATVHGSPTLPQVSPILPQVSPILPGGQLPLSTWDLGFALKSAMDAGVPKLACIHFNNCFNMSVEVLHTVAPYAEFAAGYPNYNFFTAGEAYPPVFAKLQAAGTATTKDLANWFSDGNGALLAAKGNHPTVGCVVELSRMHSISECIDDLADALLAALRGASPTERPAIVDRIQSCIIKAQQFDVNGNYLLDTPDELTDIASLAAALRATDFGSYKVQQAAAALLEVLDGIKHYDGSGSPWMAPGKVWDFSEKTLAMNIFLPDPLRIGLWDWRSPYYLDVNPDPARPRVQPNIIEFVKVTDWVDFIIEYHKDVAFKGLLPAVIPEFPVYRPNYVPPGRGDVPTGGCGDHPKGDTRPPGTTGAGPVTVPGTVPGTAPGTRPGTVTPSNPIKVPPRAKP